MVEISGKEPWQYPLRSGKYHISAEQISNSKLAGLAASETLSLIRRWTLCSHANPNKAETGISQNWHLQNPMLLQAFSNVVDQLQKAAATGNPEIPEMKNTRLRNWRKKNMAMADPSADPRSRNHLCIFHMNESRPISKWMTSKFNRKNCLW